MAAVILQVPNCHEHNKTKINFLFLSLRYQCGIFTTSRTCLIVNIFLAAAMKLQFATSSESLDGRVSILDCGRWNLKFLNICVQPHFRFRTITIKDLNILLAVLYAAPSPSIFVHDFNILTPGEAAHSPGRQCGPGAGAWSPM